MAEQTQAEQYYEAIKAAFVECTEHYPSHWENLNGQYADVRWGYPCDEERGKIRWAERCYVNKCRKLDNIRREIKRRQKVEDETMKMT